MYKSDRESLRDRRYVTSSAVAPEHLWNIKTIFTRYDAAVSVQSLYFFSSKKKKFYDGGGRGTLTRLTFFSDIHDN